MTALDALAAQERQARDAVHSRLRELHSLADRASFAVQTRTNPSTHALKMKADAVAEAVDILDAIREAQQTAAAHRAGR